MAFCKAQNSENETPASRCWLSDLDINKTLNKQTSSWVDVAVMEQNIGRPRKRNEVYRKMWREKKEYEKCEPFQEVYKQYY